MKTKTNVQSSLTLPHLDFPWTAARHHGSEEAHHVCNVASNHLRERAERKEGASVKTVPT